MKKLKKLNLDELKRVVPHMSVTEMQMISGGYDDGDCFWRCMAYLQSCGNNYNQDAAMQMAQQYYGDNFDENNYALNVSAEEEGDDVRTQISNIANGMLGHSGNHCSGNILFFDPDNVPGFTNANSGNMHAVLLNGVNMHDSENPDDWTYEIFDPQSDQSYSIPKEYIDGYNNFTIKVQ